MIRNLVRSIAFMLCLSTVTCWLYYKSRLTQHQQYDEASQLLTTLSRLDTEINAEVLKLQFEMRANYDRLTWLEQSFSNCTSRVNQYGHFTFDSWPSEQVHNSIQPFTTKQHLVTDFKALHAVLQNSLAIFRRSGKQLDAHLHTRANTNRMLRKLLEVEKSGMELVIIGSPTCLTEFAADVEQLAEIDIEDDPVATRYRGHMLAHARKLMSAKPEMDKLIDTLDQLPVPQTLQSLQDNAARVLSRNNTTAASYQLQLLGATLVLIAYCGYSIFSISRYVHTIRLANEKLEERVRERTQELESKGEALRNNGRFLKSILDAIDAKLCILDIDGTISATNAAWDKLAAIVSESPPAGVNYFSAFAADQRTRFGGPDVVAALNRLRDSDSLYDVVEYATSTAGERHWIQARVSKMSPRGHDSFLGFVVALINITARRRSEEDKERLNKELQSLSRQAGMAEVATGVLHNVGNVLNSINTATNQAAKLVRTSRLASLHKAERLVSEHLDDFANFVAEDPRGQQLPQYIAQIAQTWDQEQHQLLSELDELAKHVDHVKHVINVQQDHAKTNRLVQSLGLLPLINDAIATIQPALTLANIELVREFETLPPIVSDEHKILQILVNLLSNAKHAVMDAKGNQQRIVISARRLDENQIVIAITDSGVGIALENVRRICQHGFTTKRDGHGFGLHSCALLAKELGGELTFSSPGINQGATFVLHLPMQVQPDSLIEITA